MIKHVNRWRWFSSASFCKAISCSLSSGPSETPISLRSHFCSLMLNSTPSHFTMSLEHPYFLIKKVDQMIDKFVAVFSISLLSKKSEILSMYPHHWWIQFLALEIKQPIQALTPRAWGPHAVLITQVLKTILLWNHCFPAEKCVPCRYQVFEGLFWVTL